MKDSIQNKIKKITIYTKRLTQTSLTGDYLSAFKGTGLEFDQLREYQIGDDIRFIDWNSSAKRDSCQMNKMMVKQFVEERDRVIILAIDVSASSGFSSQSELRSETISQVAAALAFIATQNKDKVGALFFSDKVEKWIQPKRGRSHYGKIIETLLSIKPTGKSTSIEEALRFLVSLKKRNSIVFMLSDWIDGSTTKTENTKYAKLLKIASIKFDFISIRFLDACEQKLPHFGLIDIQDPESGTTRSAGCACTIDTKSKNRSKNINLYLKIRKIAQEKMFKKYKIDLLDLTVGKPFANKMIEFFRQRIRRQI